MNCGCENKRLGQEKERHYRIGKALARAEGEPVVLFQRPDGTYGICNAGTETDNKIIEIISPY